VLGSKMAYRQMGRSDAPVALLLVSPAFAKRFAASLHNCKLVQLGAGLHYLQEDHPETIGRSVAAWIGAIEGAARDSIPVTAKAS
jgi:pimeloyl-ACP methyl ester carboxylesterase